MKTNRKAVGERKTVTHGGAPAVIQSAEKELTRTVSGLMLFEESFYEKGSDTAKRVEELSQKVSLAFLSKLAIRTRKDLKLRHAALFLCVQMLKHPSDAGHNHDRKIVADTIFQVIDRADELAEIIAIYWKDGKKPLPRQLKNGVARAFTKFDEYDFAKYNQTDKEVKLRDAMFLTHPNPTTGVMEKLWKKLVDDKLKTPDTWEVQLSAGKDKKATFTRLIKEGKLGYMALLRNLRNMVEAGVDRKLVSDAIVDGAAKSRALPFRFVSAAKHAPQFEDALSKGIVEVASALPKLKGSTLVVVDVSGSMQGQLSAKSEVSRLEAAASLAMILREQGEDVTIYATGGNDGLVRHQTALVPSRHGFALSDSIKGMMPKLGGGGIFMKQALAYINEQEKEREFDRVIVITDEQDCDTDKNSAANSLKLGEYNYLINVGTYKPALPIDRAGWTRVSGFSERVIEWMLAEEETSKN